VRATPGSVRLVRRPLPTRLLAIVIVGLIVGSISLVQALMTAGEPRVVYAAITFLALGGALSIVFGWSRAKQR
jgi:uncharacterized membrane protein